MKVIIKISIIIIIIITLTKQAYEQDIERKGGLSISIGPTPSETVRVVTKFLIEDPVGRQIGFDISKGAILDEIPSAGFADESIRDLETGELGPETWVCYIFEPLDGMYKVAIVGINIGSYYLDIFAYDIENIPTIQKLSGTTYPGKIDYYEITYSSAPGSQVKVEFVGSSEIYEVSCTTKLYPYHWNLNWYNWIKEHMEEREWIAQFADRVSILCVIGNLKDNQGNPYSVSEISPETLLFNKVLPPQPWRFKGEEKVVIILESGDNRYLSIRKGFREWCRESEVFKDFQGPVMLVKFNKVKAMETLPEMIPGKDYEVTVSGKLKNGKLFKGSAMITITEWKVKPRWKWDHPGWLNADNDVDHWWNQERDLEDWWERIRKEH